MSILLGAYSQLAFGTPKYVYEDTLSRVLEPLLTGVYKQKNVSMQLFLTGSLMEFVDSSHSAITLLIATLSKEGRLGELTGSYHQTILPILYQKDRVSEVEKTTTFISRNYRYKSRSFWCNWQVWSPTLTSMLALSRLSHVVISPYNSSTGKIGCTVPFRMMEIGKAINIVPTDVDASRAVENYSVGKINFETLKASLLHGEDNRFIMLNLDQLCKGGITSEQMSDLILTLSAEDVLQSIEDYVALRPVKMGYQEEGIYGFDFIPQGKTRSLQQLFCDDEGLNYLYRRCISLSETARLYKKDKDVRRKVEYLVSKMFVGAPYVMDANASMARGPIRSAIWKTIIELERALVVLDDFSYPFKSDVDGDGIDEILTSGKTLNAIIDSKDGALTELKYTPASLNLCDVESPLNNGSFLIPGQKPKLFRDVLVDKDYDIALYSPKDNLIKTHEYSLEQLDNKHTEFGLLNKDVEQCGICFSKYYKFSANVVRLTCHISNDSTEPMHYKFGLEFPLSLFPYVGASSFSIGKEEYKQEEKVVAHDATIARITDKQNKMKITLTTNEKCEILKRDIKHLYCTTVAEEEIYQLTFLLPLFDLNIKPGECKELIVALRVERN